MFQMDFILFTIDNSLYYQCENKIINIKNNNNIKH